MIRWSVLLLMMAAVGASAQGCAEFSHRRIAREVSSEAVAPPPSPDALSDEPGRRAAGATLQVADAIEGVAFTAAERPEPGAPGAAPASTVPTPAPKRKLIYTGELTIKVANLVMAGQELKAIIGRLDGLITQSTLDKVTFRVEPGKFDQALAEVSKLGEVYGQAIRSEDVTDQFFDINLRIEVAEASRKRLMELLERGGAVKDVLEVEKDIRRLTEEIEAMKGAVRLLADRVELATITVTLMQKEVERADPRFQPSTVFFWINRIGMKELLQASPGRMDRGGWIRGLARHEFSLNVASGRRMPEGFVTVRDDGAELTGVTAEGYRLRVTRFELDQDGSAEFWGKSLREQLEKYRGYLVSEAKPMDGMNAGLEGYKLQSTGAIGGTPWSYCVWLVSEPQAHRRWLAPWRERPRELFVIEYAQPQSAAAERIAAAAAAARGFKLD